MLTGQQLAPTDKGDIGHVAIQQGRHVRDRETATDDRVRLPVSKNPAKAIIQVNGHASPRWSDMKTGKNSCLKRVCGEDPVSIFFPVGHE